jgi:CRISPR type III-B/RAMP module RAMP protein Cmr6
LGNNLDGCKSVSLRLNKLSPGFDKDNKKQEIENICKVFNDKTRDLQIPDMHFPNEVSVYVKLQSRLIVNQAGGIIENAGLCLHRFFGYPMIPGSAVKGAAHHAAWCEWKEIPEESKEERLAHVKKMASVFGYPLNDVDIENFIEEMAKDEFKDYACKGSISFLPAIPYGDASNVKLEPDVVTSHHSKYYSSKETNAVAKDNEQPVPNFFPTVKAQATFKFTIVPSRDASDEDIKLATQWLAKALTINGIGAKTAAGYGWFTDETEKISYKQKVLEEKKIRLGEIISIKEKISELESLDGAFSAEQSNEFDDLRSKANTINAPQEIFDCLNRLASKKPLESYRTKICNLSESEFLNQCIYQFEKRKPQEKIDIVYSLREELIEIWRSLYSSTDKKIKLIVESIRKVNSTLNIGKMPK